MSLDFDTEDIDVQYASLDSEVFEFRCEVQEVTSKINELDEMPVELLSEIVRSGIELNLKCTSVDVDMPTCTSRCRVSAERADKQMGSGTSPKWVQHEFGMNSCLEQFGQTA